ncbi:hypothetical protein OKW46_005718 [Paraburkholderia sp. WSM4179]|nr:hypothetical protein [Paraburkholderia sp. WSM4179]
MTSGGSVMSSGQSENVKGSEMTRPEFVSIAAAITQPAPHPQVART